MFNIVNTHVAFKKHHIKIIKKKEKAKEISTSLDSTSSQQQNNLQPYFPSFHNSNNMTIVMGNFVSTPHENS